MKSNKIVIFGAMFLAISVGAERAMARYERQLRLRQTEVQKTVESVNERVLTAVEEQKQYDKLRTSAGAVASRIQPKSDCTQVLKWLNESATQIGITEFSCKLAAGNVEALVADGKLERYRIETAGRGTYAAFVHFADLIEHAATPMVIESIALSGDRSEPGVGKLKLVLSYLSVAPPTDASKDKGSKDAKGKS